MVFFCLVSFFFPGVRARLAGRRAGLRWPRPGWPWCWKWSRLWNTSRGIRPTSPGRRSSDPISRNVEHTKNKHQTKKKRRSSRPMASSASKGRDRRNDLEDAVGLTFGDGVAMASVARQRLDRRRVRRRRTGVEGAVAARSERRKVTCSKTQTKKQTNKQNKKKTKQTTMSLSIEYGNQKKPIQYWTKKTPKSGFISGFRGLLRVWLGLIGLQWVKMGFDGFN